MVRGCLFIMRPLMLDFMDYEFRKLDLNVKTGDICLVTDTLQMARRMYPWKT